MITEHTKSYEGKQYTFTTGISETGHAPLVIQPGHLHSRTQQPYKLVFKSLHVEGDTENEGNPILAITEWEEQHFDNAGNKIASYTRVERHVTSPSEFPTFISRLKPMLESSIYNGAVAGGTNADSAFLGYPNHRPFNADGTFNPSDISEAPTYDYHGTTEGPAN